MLFVQSRHDHLLELSSLQAEIHLQERGHSIVRHGERLIGQLCHTEKCEALPPCPPYCSELFALHVS